MKKLVLFLCLVTMCASPALGAGWSYTDTFDTHKWMTDSDPALTTPGLLLWSPGTLEFRENAKLGYKVPIGSQMPESFSGVLCVDIEPVFTSPPFAPYAFYSFSADGEHWTTGMPLEFGQSCNEIFGGQNCWFFIGGTDVVLHEMTMLLGDAVPEPLGICAMLAGLVGLAARFRKR